MLEYKVVWQREGRPKKYKIYQTYKAAEAYVDILMTSAEEITWAYDPIPSLVCPPAILEREVGEWS